MRTYKIEEEKVEIKTLRHEVLDARTCDICGKKAVSEDYWNIDMYESHGTIIEYVWDVYDSGPLTYRFDICPECFMGKFTDMMKQEFGAEVNIE